MDSKLDTFGGELRYYDVRNLGENRLYSDSRIEELLPLDTKERVDQACRQWNSSIRSDIRAELGLKLNLGNISQQVPVRVIDGFPAPFQEVIGGDQLETLWWELINFKPLFERTKSGLNLTLEKYERIRSALDHVVDRNSLEKSFQTIERILKYLDEVPVVIDRIKIINEDTLGAYFYRIPEIQIYWVVIGFMANLLDVPVEDLTVVVLTHELGHAYTHLGRDIEGENWDTEHFAGTSLGVVEGLAQYYTELLCDKISHRNLGVKVAFDRLLEMQSGPYTDYKKWFQAEGDNRNQFQEVVRYSLIEYRNKRKLFYQDFLETIREISQRIGVNH